MNPNQDPLNTRYELRSVDQNTEDTLSKAQRLEERSRQQVTGWIGRLFPTQGQKHTQSLSGIVQSHERDVLDTSNENQLKILKEHLGAKLTAAKVELASKLSAYEIAKVEELTDVVCKALDHQSSAFDEFYAKIAKLNNPKVKARTEESLDRMMDVSLKTLEDHLSKIEQIIRKSKS